MLERHKAFSHSRPLRWVGWLTLAAACVADNAQAFSHVVQPGETLAQIAGRYYGDPKLEVVLVGANVLDAYGGTIIRSGMRLEVPAPLFYRVVPGETWYDLGIRWLGDRRRADLLAVINDAVAWIAPVPGREILIPPVISHVCVEGDTLNSVWDRYMPDPTRAWELNNYNFREGLTVRRGEVLLVPVPHLRLSSEGKRAARAALGEVAAQAAGATRDLQQRADNEIPELSTDLRRGEYAGAVARGNRLLGMGQLTSIQLALVHRALLEAYVALDAWSAATAACTAWRAVEPSPHLDPRRVSPKVRAACGLHE